MDINKKLDEIQARCDAATEGPWARFSTHLGAVQMICPDTDWYERQHINDVVIATLGSEPTAEFIAAARADLPAVVAALRAVLDLCGDRIAEVEDSLPRARVSPGIAAGLATVRTADVISVVSGALAH